MASRVSSIVLIGVVALGWGVPAQMPRASAAEAALAGSPAGEEEGGRSTMASALGADPAGLDVAYRREAHGKSGLVRVRQVLPGSQVSLPLDWREPRPAQVSYRWVAVRGVNGAGQAELGAKSAPRALAAGDVATAPDEPGVYRLELSAGNRSTRLDELDVVVQIPFRYKENGYLKGYLIGTYPTERQNRDDRYAPPEGFIEVTQENRSLRLSEHFTLGEFLTKNQQNVWPKYVVVDTLLLDKLELVMQELNARGIRADRMVVMSGYRTPQYNRQGLNQGRASLSRHQFGDAADVWVDNDGDWYMDDLNGDGRRDTKDARVILEAVEAVERRHPELVGGAGIYRDNGVHGPFIHIDVRGKRARW